MTTPDEELRVSPKWILFRNDYNQWQRAMITVRNPSRSNTVVYRIRCNRARHFRIVPQSGRLEASRSQEVEIFFIPSCFVWGEQGNKYRFVIESLYPPSASGRDVKAIFQSALKRGRLPIYIKAHAIFPEPGEAVSPSTRSIGQPSETDLLSGFEKIEEWTQEEEEARLKEVESNVKKSNSLAMWLQEIKLQASQEDVAPGEQHDLTLEKSQDDLDVDIPIPKDNTAPEDKQSKTPSLDQGNKPTQSTQQDLPPGDS